MSYVVGNIGVGIPGFDISLATPQDLLNAVKTLALPVNVKVRPDGTTAVQDAQGNTLTPDQIKAMIDQARAEGAASAGASGALPSWAIPAGIALAAVLLLRK